MADIFVSYARFDKARVTPIVAALEAQGWSVWWDPAIAPGEEFDRLIAAELQRARTVVVVWTPTSVESRWVRGEARDGADRGILVPLRFEQATLPIDTRALHTIDLDAWNGAPDSPLLQPLLQAIGSRLGSAQSLQLSAPASLPITGRAGASICVLPFVNMSGDPEQEYFCDGICEDVITDLSKVSALFVVARNTSFTYKGRHVDVPQLAQRLNVSHVLEGSVRKAGGRVRITAQLIDGRTGGHAWAERFDRDLNDIFALQDEISEAIVGALKLKLLPVEKQAIENRGTSDVAAYDIYLRGRQLIRREKEAESRAAAELFRQAARLDPSFAAAHAGLAQILALMIFRRQELAKSMLAEARQASERALDLAPDLVEAWVSRAIVHMVARESDDSALAYERALALDPRCFDAHYFYARFYVTQGDHARAIEHYEKAFDINPENYLPMTLSSSGISGPRQCGWRAVRRRAGMGGNRASAGDGPGRLRRLRPRCRRAAGARTSRGIAPVQRTRDRAAAGRRRHPLQCGMLCRHGAGLRALDAPARTRR